MVNLGITKRGYLIVNYDLLTTIRANLYKIIEVFAEFENVILLCLTENTLMYCYMHGSCASRTIGSSI